MKKTLLFFTITIFLINSVSAFTFLNIYLNDKGQATFIGETSDSPSFPAGIQKKGSNVFGKTQSLTNKQANLWSFEYELEGADIILILPEGAVIKSISNGDISILNNQISISSTDSISISYEINESLIVSNSSPNNILIGIILVAVLIVLIVFLINYSKREKIKEEQPQEKIIKEAISQTKKSSTKDKIKIISSILSEREKTILNALKKSGKTKQSYLRKLTDIPKASFSRHIQELEKKKLIKRSGEGKNKFVELVD